MINNLKKRKRRKKNISPIGQDPEALKNIIKRKETILIYHHRPLAPALDPKKEGNKGIHYFIKNNLLYLLFLLDRYLENFFRESYSKDKDPYFSKKPSRSSDKYKHSESMRMGHNKRFEYGSSVEKKSKKNKKTLD